MKHWLLCHSTSPPSPVRKIAVDAARLVDGRLSLVYMASGDMEALRIPAETEPGHADDLWRHTCFEAFLRGPAGEPYFELNLSPSLQWAAYRFDHYRSGMVRADVAAPSINSMSDARHLSLVANIDLGSLPELVPWETWRIGLSAVIEADDGTISHWSLAHPSGRPDFHHRDCFAAQLAPAETL